ncbi:pseudouridine synthase [Russula earlei]|uniref:Pseudouridine synthase n=1 Tax=Russula earlei TaxID=71964 RepID=A0ACC0U7C3_9AGAM|nr:pseudouridine synthase [Russula earlei]
MGLVKADSVVNLGHAARSRSMMVSAATRTGVLYLDRGVIALNKPPGLVSQGTSLGSTNLDAKNDHGPPTTSAFNDVLDALRRRYDLGTNPYPVHRLDKGTTGVLVLARTKASARDLSRQFRTHAIEKTYLALVRATAGTSFPAKEGLITSALTLDRDGRVRVRAGASESRAGPRLGDKVKAARTAWRVLTSSDVAPLSLVRLFPHTGVKHQLRVHMAHVLGVPVFGDALYGGATTSPHDLALTSVPEGRLFLHSSSISFWRYRREGHHKRFRLTIAAPLPTDFTKLCQDINLNLPEGVIEGGAFIDDKRLEGEQIPSGGRWVGDTFSI